MKIENGEWIMTAAELAACYEETGNTPGVFSLIPKGVEEGDGTKRGDDYSSLSEEQRAVLDQCLRVLGDPEQLVLLHYTLADTTVSRSTLAISSAMPGAWATLVQSGKTLQLSFRSPLEIRNLVFEVLAADHSVRPTKLGCDLSTEAALAFLALLDQHRRSWLVSLLKHLEPISLFTVEDVKERLNEAAVNDFRWSLPFVDKVLPIPVSEMAVAQDPRPALLELAEAEIIEPVDEDAAVFDMTDAGMVLVDGNKQAASRLVLTRTYHTEDGEPAHDVFVLTRTTFDLFMLSMGGAEASLRTLLPGDLDLLIQYLFPVADSTEGTQDAAEQAGAQEAGEAEPGTPAPTPPPVAAQASWFMSRAGQRFGPYSWEDLRQSARDGNLKQEDLLWQPGMTEWVKAGEREGLF